VLMPVGTDVSCEDMFADESDFEFDVENEGAVASATEAKQAQAVTLTARAVPLTAQAVPLTAQAAPITAQAANLTAHTSKVLGNVRFLFGLITVKSCSHLFKTTLKFSIKNIRYRCFFRRKVALGRGLDVGKAFFGP
jgi:hypothetical protein